LLRPVLLRRHLAAPRKDPQPNLEGSPANDPLPARIPLTTPFDCGTIGE